MLFWNALLWWPAEKTLMFPGWEKQITLPIGSLAEFKESLNNVLMLFTVEYCRKIKFLPDCIRPGNTFGWHKTWKLQRLELRHPSPRHCCMSPFHSRWLMWTNWTKGCHQWNTNWKLSGNLSALKHSENYNEGSLFHHFHLTYEVWFTTRWVRLEAIGSGFGVCWWIHQQDHSNLDAVFGKRRIKTLKDSIAWNNLIFSWTSSSGLCSVWGSQELDMVLRPWSLHWMRSLGAVAKVADLAASDCTFALS